MEHNSSPAATKVAQSTTTAAHRRDHEHDADEGMCHPHDVEVVHLGERAFAVCHDCHSDSGYLPLRRAENVALEHRRRTATDDVALAPGGG